MKTFWAIFLVAIGAFFLAINFGVLTPADGEKILRFWPIILVLVGVYLIVKGTKAAATIMLVAALAAVAFVYIAGFGPSPIVRNGRVGSDDQVERQVKDYSISVDSKSGAKRIDAEVNTGAVNFNIEDGTEKAMEGTLRSSFLEPQVESDLSGDVLNLGLDTVSFRRKFFFRDFKNELKLKFNEQLPLNLKVNTGASDLDFDLTRLKISEFILRAGASDISLRLGEAVEQNAKLDFEVGVSDIKLEVPKGVGVKVTAESGLTTQNFNGFTKRDGAYYSEGYDGAAKKIEVVFKTGASSITINRY